MGAEFCQLSALIENSDIMKGGWGGGGAAVSSQCDKDLRFGLDFSHAMFYHDNEFVLHTCL